MPTMLDKSQYTLGENNMAAAPAPAPVASDRYQLLPQEADGASPQAPLQLSPLDVTDRVAVAFGNTKGSLSYLKKKFQDVQYDADKGFVVQKEGLWYKADPSMLGKGDAWDKTKELVADAAEWAPEAMTAAITYGTTKLGENIVGGIGAAIPAPGANALTAGAGKIAGGLLGAGIGGAISSGIKTRLGRLFGTYDPEPEEEMRDIGLEALLNMGGQAVAPGVKPFFSMIGKGVKNVAQWASPGVKATLSAVLAKTTGAAKENMVRLLDRAPQVMGQLDSAVASEGAEGAVVKLKTQNINKVKALMAQPWKALSGFFDKEEDKLLQLVPDKLSFDVGGTVGNAFKELEKLGVVVPVVEKMGPSGKVLQYKLGNREALAQFLVHPEGEASIAPEAMQALGKFMKMGNEYLATGKQQGADAVKSLINVRRTFDKFYYKATAANPGVKETLTPVSSSVRNGIVEAIHGVSPEVADQYVKMNAKYVEHMPLVAAAERISGARNFRAPETFVEQLMSPEGKNVMNKRLVDVMAGLKGKGGQEIAEGLKDGLAAHDFISKWPQLLTPTAKKLAGAGGIAYGASHIGLGTVAAGTAAVAGIPLAAASSPRLVGRTASAAAKALPALGKFGDFLKGLPPDKMRQLLASPDAFNTLVRATADSIGQEEEVKASLLSMAGVDQ
jgi:hypothetical protein